MNASGLVTRIARRLLRKALLRGVDSLAGGTAAGRQRAAQTRKLARHARLLRRLLRRNRG